MVPPSLPPPAPPLIDELTYIVNQCAGVALTIISVSVTVFGLHGLKVYDSDGQALRCTKSLYWYGAVGVWGLGQVLQVPATFFAEEPVFAAVANFAIMVNACLSMKLQGEQVTPLDVAAMVAMIGGACLVVASTPTGVNELSLHDLGHLFTSSPIAAVGVLGTTAVALATLPRAAQSVLRPGTATAGPAGGVAFGLLAGFSGATCTTVTKICLDLLSFYSWKVFTLPEAWGLGCIALSGEAGMFFSLTIGMSHHESTIVVGTYYITATLFCCVQGLVVFDLLPHLTPIRSVGFCAGLLLCILAVLWMAGMRSQRPPRTGATTSTSGRTQRLHLSNVDDSVLLDGQVHVVEDAHCGGGGLNGGLHGGGVHGGGLRGSCGGVLTGTEGGALTPMPTRDLSAPATALLSKAHLEPLPALPANAPPPEPESTQYT